MRPFAVLLIVVLACFQNGWAQCSLTANAVVTNVSCNAGSNGAITTVITQGTPPFSYSWSTGSTASSLSSITAGTYSVTITDALGCSAALSNIIVTEPMPFIYNVTIHNVTCFGGSDGFLDFFLSGGTPPYSYLWINAATGDTIATTQDISNLKAGIYGISIVDANGCTGGIYYLIAEAQRMTISGAVTHVTCPDGRDGSIALTVTGGTGTKSYQWSTGENSKNLLNKPAGTYSVTVTDVNGCTVSSSFTITQPAPFNATAAISSVSCNGFSDGAIDITLSGGTPPYTFTWSNGQTTEDIGNLPAGQYCVTLTDSRNCVSVPFCFTVSEPPSLQLSATVIPVLCEGDSNGGINLSMSGGTPPYIYSWSNGAVTEDLNNLSEGTYSVIVTDANGCSASATYTINPPNRITINIGIVNATCADSDGAVFVSVSGGSPPFFYRWNTGASASSISNLPAGSYSVIVTDANGCTASAQANVSNISSMELTVSVMNDLCGTGNTGAIDLTITDGSAPFTFAWSNGASSEDLSGIAAGNYSVTVTNAQGCSKIMTIEVGEDSGFVLTVSSTPSNCIGFTGSATASVSGGTAPYTFSWSNGQSTSAISNLPQGVYGITVTDANGCSASASVMVDDAGAPSLSFSKQDASCSGSDGSISISASGGTPPYSYQWSNGATTFAISSLASGTYIVTVADQSGCSSSALIQINAPEGIIAVADRDEPTCPDGDDGAIDITVVQGTAPFSFVWSNGNTSQDITGIASGNYSLSIGDGNSCSLSMTMFLNDPDELIITEAANIPPLCNDGSDGSLSISISGGTPPYSIEWSTGDTTTVITGLSAGEYCAVVTDSAGCVSAPFCFTVTEPTEISITAEITNATCAGGNDGAIDITVSGGTLPYTYSWTAGITSEDLTNLSPGLYTVFVTDANGCTMNATYTVRAHSTLIISLGITQPLCGESNGSVTITVSGGTPPVVIQWSTGQSGATISSLPAGSYGVTVTDANGCTASETADISSVNDISISGNVSNTACGIGNTGAIDITVTGGTSPLTFQWSNGAVTEDITGLDAGNYTVTLTDSTGCQEVMTFEVIEESGLNLIATTISPSCGQSNGSISVSVSGGTPPYSYSWNTGQTNSAITGLDAGIYIVTITDANGCEETQIIPLNDIDGPQISINTTDITCDNPAGALEAVITSSSPPFMILWSTGDSSAVITGLEPGTYTVEVTDSAGCTTAATATLTASPGIIINAAHTEPSCNGSTDGSIDVMVIQGTPPFTFQWSGGENTEDISGIGAGTYSVTVTDSNGCPATTTIIVDEPEEIAATTDTLTQPLCNGDSTGGINITVTGGTPPYNYNWSNDDTTEDLTGIATGQYCVVITDAHGCVSDTFCFFLNEPQPVQIQPNITQPACNGEDNGSISVTVSGGVPSYTLQWSTGDTITTISGLTAGNYSLTATDANGCTAAGNFTVEQPDSLIVTIVDSSDVQCSGANNGSITVQVSGGTPPYNYNWSNGDASATVTGLPPGTYDVTVTDANGCGDTSDIITITQPDSLLVTGNITQPVCSLTGNIDVTVIGGTLPYNYLWNTGDTTEDVSGLSGGGIYSITVTDSNGCTASASFTIIEPPVMDVLIEQTQQLICNGDSNAALCAQVTGVPGPYFYQWSTGDTTQCISGVGAGIYSVTVANGSGCSAYENGFVVFEPNPFSIAPVADSVTCNGGSDGSLSVNISGGTPPYTYLWDDGSTGNSLDSLFAGPVSVTVTDANECTASFTVNIPEPAPFDFSNSIITPNTCDTTTDGSIIVIATGGTPPYTFVWDDGTTGNLLDSLDEGDYSVTVTDANACTGSATFIIDGPPCNEPPVAIDDTAKIFVCRNSRIDIPVMNNDYDPDGDDIFVSAIFTTPFHGTVRINSDQTITYIPDSTFIGIDTFSYIICESNTQPSLCDTGWVVITVLPCRPNIFIPTGFSPNGDGTNDNFDIPGIEFFPDNVLMIFNRWGNKVREFFGYKNEWTGTNEHDKPLPDGTYYFILELHDDANTTYTGYVVIHR
ncbi:MAG TPA: gliding motility-associated C-terminal domain-containing protein [Chitinophagales bacterium]|nr:gliding motility-associated C-terminal domain-containing protein [Chitinophagales bacterium]